MGLRGCSRTGSLMRWGILGPLQVADDAGTEIRLSVQTLAPPSHPPRSRGDAAVLARMIWGVLGELEKAANRTRAKLRAPRDHCPVVRRVVVDDEDRGVSHQHQPDPVAWLRRVISHPSAAVKARTISAPSRMVPSERRRPGTPAPDGA